MYRLLYGIQKFSGFLKQNYIENIYTLEKMECKERGIGREGGDGGGVKVKRIIAELHNMYCIR